MSKSDYDTTLARIAGNIAAGLVTLRQADVSYRLDRENIALYAVDLARDIVAAVKRTQLPDGERSGE